MISGIWRLTEHEVSEGYRGCGKPEHGQSRRQQKNFPVAMRLGDTPVLIPNTMVKTLAAEGTILETIWESRRLPEFKGA